MLQILIISHRSAERNVLAGLAEQLGADLESKLFATPGPARDWLAKQGGDVAIIDGAAGEIPTIEAIRALRQVQGHGYLRILVLLPIERRRHGHSIFAAGADDLVFDPIDDDEFCARMRMMVTLCVDQKIISPSNTASSSEMESAEPKRFLDPHRDLDSSRYEARLIQASTALITTSNRQNRLTLINDAHQLLMEDDVQGLIGRDLEALYGRDLADRHRSMNAEIFETGKPLDSFKQMADLRGNGEQQRTYLTTKSPLFDETGRVAEVITVAIDITAQCLSKASERHRVADDPLTGLPRRDAYLTGLEHALQLAKRRGDLAAILLLDLDRFKSINDIAGITFGDRLLRAVADRLKRTLGDHETIARLGGDEFLIHQDGIRGPAAAQALATRLNHALAEPFKIKDEDIHISASIGITLYPADGQNSDQLVKNAELAMYRAKSIGRNGHCFFAPKMNFAARRTGLLEQELRQAFNDDQFTVHYQPQRELVGNRILGMEALMRWRHGRRGMVRPTEFIGLIEDIGLMAPLTERILDQACRQLLVWKEAGLPSLRLSVNLSPIQFREKGIVALIEAILERTGIDPGMLEIELTEGVMLENSRTVIDSIERLNALGITFSLDDFGTGYSSLSYVRRLPVHRLKIDQSFVHRLGQDKQDDAIIDAVIDLGHSLGLKVTAEGVETKAQLERLADLGCDEAQGDLISPPLPAEAFELLFAEPRQPS